MLYVLTVQHPPIYSVRMEGFIFGVFEDLDLCVQHRENISSGFSINSEAFASEFIENLEDMFSRFLWTLTPRLLASKMN